jgi:diadenosine tetraphosphatase ApaH/serine/threonine PP2A family protein phosphatase
LIKKIGKTTVINPGSVGQSKDVPGVASYAVWNDGEAEIKRVEYDINKTVEKILSSPLEDYIKKSLIQVLRYGSPL